MNERSSVLIQAVTAVHLQHGEQHAVLDSLSDSSLGVIPQSPGVMFCKIPVM